MRDSIWHQVRQIASDIFNLPLEAVTPQSSPDTIENWDSLQQVNLVLALEQTFHLQFRPEEIAEMLNIETIASLVEEKLRERQLAQTQS
jgi:acyl carrier protein